MAPKMAAIGSPGGERVKKDTGGEDYNKERNRDDNGEDRNDKEECWCRNCQAWQGHDTNSSSRGGPVGPRLKDCTRLKEAQVQDTGGELESQSTSTSETTSPNTTPSDWRDAEIESQGPYLVAPVGHHPLATHLSVGTPVDTRVTNSLALTRTESRNHGKEACIHCSRPNFGRGENVWVLANYFAVTLPKTKLHTYTLQGIPQIITREKKQRIVRQLVATWPLLNSQPDCWATDHASLVVASCELSAAAGGAILQSGESVDSPPIQYFTAGSSTPSQLHITLQYNGVLDFAPYSSFMEGKAPDANITNITQALNVIMAKHTNTPNHNGHKDLLQVGTNRLFYKAGWKSLRAGLVAYRGYSSSVRPGMSQVLLNVNKLTAAFFKPECVHEFIREWLNLWDARALHDHEVRELNNVLRGVKVRIMYDRSKVRGADIDSEPQRTKLVMGMGQPLRTQRYTKDGQEVLVRDHLTAGKSIKLVIHRY